MTVVVGIISFIMGVLITGIVCRNILKTNNRLYGRIRELKIDITKCRQELRNAGIEPEIVRRRRG